VSAGQQKLGALLLEMGFVDQGELTAALAEQRTSGKRLGKILIEGAVITEDRLVHALSRQLGIEACDPIMTPVHPAVLAMLPAEVAFQHRILPVARQREGASEVLYVATADPLDAAAADAAHGALPAATRIRWMLAGETEMDLALARHYGAAPNEPRRAPPPPAAGVAVITGTPVTAPPRRPDGAHITGSLTTLSTTDDIFAALQEAVEAGPGPQPRTGDLRPRRSDSQDGAPVAAKLAPAASAALRAPAARLPSWPPTPADAPLPGLEGLSEPIEVDLPFPAEAEDVDLGTPAPAVEVPARPTRAPDPPVLSSPPRPEREALSSGPSWGDLLGSGEGGVTEGLLGALAEAADLPEGTASLAAQPIPADEDTQEVPIAFDPAPEGHVLSGPPMFELEAPVDFAHAPEASEDLVPDAPTALDPAPEEPATSLEPSGGWPLQGDSGDAWRAPVSNAEGSAGPGPQASEARSGAEPRGEGWAGSAGPGPQASEARRGAEPRGEGWAGSAGPGPQASEARSGAGPRGEGWAGSAGPGPQDSTDLEVLEDMPTVEEDPAPPDDDLAMLTPVEAPAWTPVPEAPPPPLGLDGLPLDDGVEVSVDLGSQPLDVLSADLPVGLDGLPLDDSLAFSTELPRETDVDRARALLGRFAAGEPMAAPQMQWILRFLASAALHADALANEAALRFVGPPPDEPDA
jgi:hypothetical protein